MNYVTLNNGVKMPVIGFGVFEIPKEETARCVYEAWGPLEPLAQHRLKEIIENTIVKEIADNHGKTPAQIALRQQVQRGIVVIPKSTHKDRMKQNLDIFNFELTEDEMTRLKQLDENKSM